MAKPTVLLVDDEERALFGLGHVLRADGYRLLFAAGPEEALRVLSAAPVEAVISDQMMPGMSGLELLAIVRDRHPGVARLMLTGCGDAALGEQARRSGVLHGFMQKPCDRREVQATVRAAVELVRELRDTFAAAGDRAGGGRRRNG